MATSLMLGLLIVTFSFDFSVAQIGVAYGRNGDGLPPPSQAVELYKQNNIQRMRIYDTDQETLQALRGSGIELTVGILNKDLETLDAGAWVRDNILAYHPDVNFRHIVVGNEVRPGRSDTEQYVPFVLPAMQNIYNALPDELRATIKVTTAVDNEVIDPDSNYPPENGRFRPEVAPYLDPIIRFLVDTDAPLFASIYPYFAYLNNIGVIDLRYALLDPNFPGVTTPSGTVYKNLFYALLDTVNAALEKSVDSMSFEVNTDAVNDSPIHKGSTNNNPLKPKGSKNSWADLPRRPRPGGGGASTLASTDAAGKRAPPKVKGGESGWSGRGSRRGGAASTLASTDAGADDAASIENASAYVNNLVQAVKDGTPMRPGEPIETYIFAMFDENQKPGDEDERNFGLFLPDGQPKYQVNFG